MKKLLWIPLAAAMTAGSSVQAADRGPRHGVAANFPYSAHYMPQGHTMRTLPTGCARVMLGGQNYYYWEGMYYQPAASGYVVVPAPVGAVVTTLPPGCQQVFANDTLYYIINGVAYTKTVYGYQVAPLPTVLASQPVVTAAPPATVAPVPIPSTPPPVVTPAGAGSNDVFTINIPNAKGAYTPVALKRSGTGFIGPQGDFYPEFPRVEQLKLMYGK